MSNYKLDYNRLKRTGFPEVVFGGNKDVDTLKSIISDIVAKQRKALITKVQKEKYDTLKLYFPVSLYDEISQVLVIGKFPKTTSKQNSVAILSGGTSDEFVVNEAFYTLSFLGIHSKKYFDVGVAGLHRLIEYTEELKEYKVIIVCAGFEGALPTVVGGLFPQPIIAVPVSIGYGVAAGGITALNSMLSSCANGITVVNIDNGYGAAIAAFRILNGTGQK